MITRYALVRTCLRPYCPWGLGLRFQRSKLGEGKPWLIRSCFNIRALSFQTSFSLLSRWTSSSSCCMCSCLRFRLLRAARVFWRRRHSIFSCSVASSGRGPSRVSSSPSEHVWDLERLFEVEAPGNLWVLFAQGGDILSRKLVCSRRRGPTAWFVLYKSGEGWALFRWMNDGVESEIDLEWVKAGDDPVNIDVISAEVKLGDMSNGEDRENSKSLSELSSFCDCIAEI